MTTDAEEITKEYEEFEDIDVSKDATAAEEMIKKSGQRGVPVIEIDEKVIVGFDKGAIDSSLSL